MFVYLNLFSIQFFKNASGLNFLLFFLSQQLKYFPLGLPGRDNFYFSPWVVLLEFVLYYFLFPLYWKRSFIVAAVARIFLLSRLGFIVAPNVFTIFITNLAIFAAAFFLV